MKYYFIINPESGRFANDKEGFIERIDKACRLRDIKYEIHYTDGFGKARKVAESIPNDEESIVFSVGGDGNLNEIINGVVKNHMTVGVIPAGSGNDFYRTLSALGKGEHRCDLGIINDKYFINIACIGLDADIANNISVIRQKKWIPVGQRYTCSIIYSYFKYKFKELTTIFGEQSKKGEYTIVTVCNGQYYGGGHRIAPHALIDDGYFEIYMVDKMPKILIPGLLLKLKSGRHEKSKRVVRYTDKGLKIQSDTPVTCNVDGEMLTDTDFEIRIEKSAIKVFNDPQFVKEIVGNNI